MAPFLAEGRDSKGNRLGTGSLWRFFFSRFLFGGQKETGPPEAISQNSENFSAFFQKPLDIDAASNCRVEAETRKTEVLFMKKALCFILSLLLLLALAACGRKPAPTPETEEDSLERALAWLHAQKGTYAQRHINTYLELYRMTHPGANLAVTGLSADNKQVRLEMTGLDVRAFAESGFLPDFVTVRSYGFANEFVPLSEPIPREPEWDRVS